VLHGPPASGKSHLAAVWADRAGATVLEAADLESGIPQGAMVVENVAPGVPEAPLFALLERGAPLLLTAQLRLHNGRKLAGSADLVSGSSVAAFPI
jgi:hypothetical protein